MRINLEPLNFSGVARIKIGHTPLLGSIRKCGWKWGKEHNFSVSCAFCLRANCDGQRGSETFIWTEKKHEASAANIENYVKFYIFGSVKTLSLMNEGYRVSVQCHSKLVLKNWHIWGRIINCIKFCETHELPLRRHDESRTSYNRVKFLDIVSELVTLDSVSDEHLRSATVSKCTPNSKWNTGLQAYI